MAITPLQNSQIVTPKTMSEQVYNLLRQKIIDQEIKPGEVLMEVAVSEALGVSRTPVRESFRLLQHEGLVVKNPKGGVVVTELSIEELKEVCDLRLVFEVHSIGLTCDNISEEEIAELERITMEADEMLNESDAANELDLLHLGSLNTRFHDVLCKSAGSDYLSRMLKIIRMPIMRYRPFSLETAAQRARAWADHKKIISLLKERNKPALKKLMKKHIRDAGRAMEKQLKQA